MTTAGKPHIRYSDGYWRCNYYGTKGAGSSPADAFYSARIYFKIAAAYRLVAGCIPQGHS